MGIFRWLPSRVAALSMMFLMALNLSASSAAGEASVTASPSPAARGLPLSITYDAVVGSLPDDTSQVTLHWGYDGSCVGDWLGVTDSAMSPVPGAPGLWNVIITVPDVALCSVDFVFTDGLGAWDNNGGENYFVIVWPPEAVYGDPPVADAGVDQVLWDGEDVILDGSGSSDPEGRPLTYLWTMGDKVVGSEPIVLAPSVEVGVYEYVLTVSDGLNSSKDSVLIEVNYDCPRSCRMASIDRGGPAWMAMTLLPPVLLLWRRRRRAQ